MGEMVSQVFAGVDNIHHPLAIGGWADAGQRLNQPHRRHRLRHRTNAANAAPPPPAHRPKGRSLYTLQPRYIGLVT